MSLYEGKFYIVTCDGKNCSRHAFESKVIGSWSSLEEKNKTIESWLYDNHWHMEDDKKTFCPECWRFRKEKFRKER